MSATIVKIIKESRDTFVVRDSTLLEPNMLYYFTKSNNDDKNIYRGIFKQTYSYTNFNYIGFIFTDVEVYHDNVFIEYVPSLSTCFVNKIYSL